MSRFTLEALLPGNSDLPDALSSASFCGFSFRNTRASLALLGRSFKMAHRTYLVMTAADAFEHNKQCPHGIVSLNQMLETRAREQADVICTGFNTKSGDIFGCDTLSTCFPNFRLNAVALNFLAHSVLSALLFRQEDGT